MDEHEYHDAEWNVMQKKRNIYYTYCIIPLT